MSYSAQLGNFTDMGIRAGGMSPGANIQGAVPLANMPVAALYTGLRAYINDSAAAPVFSAVAVGGGALIIPVYSDGVTWRNG